MAATTASSCERGFPAVRFTRAVRELPSSSTRTCASATALQYGDLLEFVDFDYLRRVNRLVVASLASLAVAPASPDNVRIITDGVNAYNATVAWDASNEPDVVGYEIVWRDIDVAGLDRLPVRPGRVTRGEVIDLSKDNIMIGVRAVDAQGNRSPVALAR